MTRLHVARAAIAALAVIAWTSVHAQFPSRSVTLVVPFSPGGGIDRGARLVANKLTERWGKAVIVENKPGAAGILGAEQVAKAAPDGYTLLMGNVGTQSINPSLYKTLPYDPDHAFVPVSLVAELPLVLLVHPSVGAKSPRELVALAKSKPAQLSYSSSGSGGSMHLAAALFENLAAVQFLHVPYKGDGQAISDLIAGQVHLSFVTLLESIGHIHSGKLRALAVTTAQRSPVLPTVPTVAESGVPGYTSASWIGLLAPAGTPAPTVEKIAKDVHKAVQASDVRSKLLEQGAIPLGGSPAQFRSRIDNDRRHYARIIREQNITVE